MIEESYNNPLPSNFSSLDIGDVIKETEKNIKKSPFTDIKIFEDYQVMAKSLSQSELVPDRYRGKIGDCIIAMEIADRVGSSPLMVMQSLYVVYGNPGWSAQWVIAMLNSCGRFGPVQFDISPPDKETQAVEYVEFVWNSQAKKKLPVTKSINIYNRRCTAKVRCLKTGDTLDGPEVSIVMAVKEGWYTRPGSKWPTMGGIMLRYRSASFLGKLYVPDLLMGLKSVDELTDIGPLNMSAIEPAGKIRKPKQLPEYTADQLKASTVKWQHLIDKNKTTPEKIISKVSSSYALSGDQIKTINDLAKSTVVDAEWVDDYKKGDKAND